MSLGLYLHIPYCFSKCRYCDFYSAPGQRGVPPEYPDALLRELHRFAPDAPLRPDTIYFGGGTPSLLTPDDVARLMEAAQPRPGAEITLEANPETVTEETLRGFRAAGVNRISFGVQSARDSQQYEISNFARPGYEGKHNLIYWDCGEYLGLGPAAHSCMGGKRFYYPPDTDAFLHDTAAPVLDGSCGAEDYLILQLRLRKGLNLEAYKNLYGKEFSTAQLAFVQNCVKAGYANFDGKTLALTPAGLIVQNTILAELL